MDKQRNHDVEEGQHKKRIEESLSKTNSTKVDTDSTVNIADGKRAVEELQTRPTLLFNVSSLIFV